MAGDVMKRITGEPRLKARKMRQNFESFENVTTLWMAGNDKPQVDGLDDAIWRRIRLIPFTVTVPEGRRDPALARTLLEESNGILGWLLEGMALYQREGLTAPAAVKLATADYREESNPLREWLDAEEIVLDADADSWEQAAELRKAYERWATSTRHAKVPIGKKWGAALEGLGCTPSRTKDGNRWHGVRLPKRPPSGMGF